MNEVTVKVSFAGREYSITVLVKADTTIGVKRRRCIAPNCSRHAGKKIISYKFVRMSSVFDEKIGEVISNELLVMQMEKDQGICWAAERAAGKEFNLWLDQREKADFAAPEFQPGGRRSIEEDLPLCEYCLELRKNIMFSDCELMTAAE